MMLEEVERDQPYLLDVCSLPIFDRECMDGVGVIVVQYEDVLITTGRNGGEFTCLV